MMSNSSDRENDVLRKKVIGLGEGSIRKSYHSDLKKTLDELAKKNELLLEEIAQRERYQQELRDLNEQLELKIESRTKEIKETNKFLRDTLEQLKSTQADLVESRKMAALSTLVSGISHELNTPLGNALTTATFIQDIIKELANQDKNNQSEDCIARKKMDEIKNAINILLHSLQRSIDLVSKFKVASDQQVDASRKSFSLKVLVEHLFSIYSQEFSDKCITAVVHGDENACMEGYPTVYSQILANLIVNSLSHGFTNKAEGTINVHFIISGDKLQLQYCDDGVGIATDNLGRVFDPFFTTKMGEHSGLGLYSAYLLVAHRLRGAITCDSEPGKGVIFTISVPVDKGFSK